MNCSMMCKALLLAAAVFLSGAMPISARELGKDTAEPDVEELTAEEGILLVHGKRLSEAESGDIAYITEMATAMGKAMDFWDAAACTGILEEYDYIICYQLDSPPEEFLEALCGYSGNLMVIGSGFMADYLEASGRAERIVSEEVQEKGRLRYAFGAGKEFEEIVKTKALHTFLGDGYANGEIVLNGEAVPFCQEIDGVRFIPVTDFANTLAKAALMEETARWMQSYEGVGQDYAQALVLDNVYPFMEPRRLKDIVDAFIENDVAFVISVMPLTGHNDYPAMKEFCQVLSYAQANGGAVILHAPIVHEDEPALEGLQEQLTDMTLTFIENGVYPLGIGVPFSWTNHETYLEALKRYRTVFVYDDGQDHGFDIEAHRNALYYNRHQLFWPVLELDETGTNYAARYASAIYLDAADLGPEEIARAAERAGRSSVPFRSLWDLDHAVQMDGYSLTYENRILRINQEAVSIRFEPYEFEEDYDYGRDIFYRATVELQNENRGLIVCVAVLTVLFLYYIVYARLRNRRYFFRKEADKKSGTDQGKGV